MMAAPITKSAVNYRVAWVSALHIERASAEAMLDEKHEEPTDFNRNLKDQNSYDWGSIRGHDIVLTSLPVADCGKVSAATCVTELLSSLPHIKFGLLVGIGAGLPNVQNDIQLGDVVVGQPDQSHGGVIQYDLGKAISDGTWEPKGFLSPPPHVLLNALSQLKTKHEGGLFRHVDFLDKAMKRNTFWGARYAYPEDKENGFSRCKRQRERDGMKIYTADGELIRPPRLPETPHIHYGTIASGDTLVKDEITRDIIPGKVKQTCLCIEMEAAGLLNVSSAQKQDRQTSACAIIPPIIYHASYEVFLVETNP